MMRPEPIDATKLEDHYALVAVGEETKAYPCMTPENFQLLFDRHNELVEAFNELLNALEPTGIHWD